MVLIMYNCIVYAIVFCVNQEGQVSSQAMAKVQMLSVTLHFTVEYLGAQAVRSLAVFSEVMYEE